MKMQSYLGAAAISLAAIAATVLPSQASPSTTRSTSTAAACAVTWGSLPKTDQLPPDASTLSDVRAGQHECYDRLVLDGASFVRVQYVDQVRADGSGAVVPLRGGARLQIITNSAGGYGNGNQTYVPANPRELVNVTGWQTFRQVAWAGDFEGQSTVGLGVRARLPFRVFVLPAADGPSRAVIDVAHQW